MIILGVDPGTARCGYGVIELKGSVIKPLGYGLLKVKKEDCASRNLLFLKQSLSEIIEEYKPDHFGIERLFFNKNVTTAMKVSEARGVLLLAAAEADLTVSEFTPQQIKSAITGNGHAPKDQVGKMVKILLGLKEVPKPDDIADALAVAIIASRTVNYLKGR